MNLEIDKLNIRFSGITEQQAREIIAGLAPEFMNQFSNRNIIESSRTVQIDELHTKPIKIKTDAHSSGIRKKMAKQMINSLYDVQKNHHKKLLK